MNLPTIPHALWWIMLPLVAWRVYVRLKRLFAHQRYSVWKHGFSVLGLSALAALMCYEAAKKHESLASLAGGLLLGFLIGGWCLYRTDFERRREGLFFTPDRYIGAALSVVLIGRLVWRGANGSTSAAGWSLQEFIHNPSTLFLYGIFSGHYIAFAAGISVLASRWSRRRALETPQPRPR